MASAFETFVQLELGRRPYLETDQPPETVLVRRGVGPRQLSSVTLADGEALGMVGGTLQGMSVATTIRKVVLAEPLPSTQWVLTHNLNSTNVIVQVTDSDGYVIIPKEIRILDNTITIDFSIAQTGTARALFLD